jgi:hypothetical protein
MGEASPTGPIPLDHVRFYTSLDFTGGSGHIRVNPTHAVGGTCGSAWPINFNSGFNHDFSVNVPQHDNYFTYQVAPDGTFRIRWSVVHGDRRTVAGALPTEAIRPAFDGTLTVRWLSDEHLEVKYDGDCFPSVEAYLVTPAGERIAVMQARSKGALYGIAYLPDCHITYTASV